MQAMHRNVRRHDAKRGDEGYNLEHRGEENKTRRKTSSEDAFVNRYTKLVLNLFEISSGKTTV